MIQLNKTVWFDPNGMESGSQRAAQLRGVARRRGGAAHQRVCGEAGLERQTAFLYLGGRGHNGARGGYSLPKRDEVDGRLHVVGCWVAAAGVRAGKKLKQFANAASEQFQEQKRRCECFGSLGRQASAGSVASLG